jgi:hypothetical protein
MHVVNVRGTPDRKLTVLPDIPGNTTELLCGNNELTELPPLPRTLIRLGCSKNKLEKLPELPPTLEALDCKNNELTTLPVLPPTLTHLWCSNNQLTALPNLPPSLSVLSCENNQLTSLPDLPPRLSRFVCTNNRFPPALQDILDQYRYDLPQLIISVNHYNTYHRLRKAGQTYRNLGNLGRSMPHEYQNSLGHVGYIATGHKPTGNLQKTFENLKRDHNTYGPRKQRKTRRKQTRKNRVRN